MIGKEEIEERLCKAIKPCPHYSKCEIDENGFYPKCVCKNACDLTDFSSALSTHPQKFFNISELFATRVCGTDGEDYLNFCVLKQKSCELKKDIGIYEFGKCSKFRFLFC